MVNTKGKRATFSLNLGGVRAIVWYRLNVRIAQVLCDCNVTPVSEVMVHLKKVMLLIPCLNSSKTSYGGDSLQLLRKDLAAFNGFLPSYI